MKLTRPATPVRAAPPRRPCCRAPTARRCRCSPSRARAWCLRCCCRRVGERGRGWGGEREEEGGVAAWELGVTGGDLDGAMVLAPTHVEARRRGGRSANTAHSIPRSFYLLWAAYSFRSPFMHHPSLSLTNTFYYLCKPSTHTNTHTPHIVVVVVVVWHTTIFNSPSHSPYLNPSIHLSIHLILACQSTCLRYFAAAVGVRVSQRV